jgi:DNA-binding PadR family transcriptional regulator
VKHASAFTDLEFVLLVMIAEGADTPDMIDQRLEQRGLNAWLAGDSGSIRFVLDRLSAQELLELHGSVYRLTESGRGVLQTASMDQLRQVRNIGQGMELGLMALHVLKPSQVYATLSEQRAELVARVSAVDMLAMGLSVSEHASQSLSAVYSHSAAMLRAEIAWLDDFLSRWRKRYPMLAQEAVPEIPESHSAPTQITRRTELVNGAKQMQRIARPSANDSAE